MADDLESTQAEDIGWDYDDVPSLPPDTEVVGFSQPPTDEMVQAQWDDYLDRQERRIRTLGLATLGLGGGLLALAFLNRVQMKVIESMGLAIRQLQEHTGLVAAVEQAAPQPSVVIPTGAPQTVEKVDTVYEAGQITDEERAMKPERPNLGIDETPMSEGPVAPPRTGPASAVSDAVRETLAADGPLGEVIRMDPTQTDDR